MASSSDMRPSPAGAGNAMVSADLDFFCSTSSPVPEGMAQLPKIITIITPDIIFLTIRVPLQLRQARQ
jgi:hypothetical protein